MYDILITGGCVITVDAAHTIHNPGYVAIKGDRIAAIGPMAECEAKNLGAARVIDATGRAVLPGMIDAHGHGGHCLIKTMGEGRDDWGDMAEDIYYHYTDAQFWHAEGALAAAERLKFGITTGVSMVGSTPRMDDIWPVQANLEGSVKVGIRQMSGIGVASGVWPKVGRTYTGEGDAYTERTVTPEMAYETTERYLKTMTGKHPRGIPIVAPSSMGYRAEESVEANIAHNRAMHRLATEYDVPLHTHGSGGDVQFLFDHTPEVLSPRLSLTHSTGYSFRELEILKETGAYVFHGPSTNANIRRHCPVYEMMSMGIGVVLVTDGTAPDRSYDIWRDMKIIQIFQRARFNDGLLLPCGTVLEMCTIRAAEALGLGGETGSLEVGKKADIITVDVEQPHLAPFGDQPIERLVYHAMGGDVDLTMVDGEIMMENRKLTLVDEKAILRDASEAYETMKRRLGRPELFETKNQYAIRY